MRRQLQLRRRNAADIVVGRTSGDRVWSGVAVWSRVDSGTADGLAAASRTAYAGIVHRVLDRTLSTARDDQSGTSALEFAIVAPIFVMLLLAIICIGLGGYYQVQLDDAVRSAARQIQIGGPAANNGSAFASAVCSQFGTIAPNCAARLTYNVQANVPPTAFAALTPVAMPASGNLPNAFPTIAGNNNVLIQVAYPLPFAVPIVGTAMTFTGTNSILATTIVLTEPHS